MEESGHIIELFNSGESPKTILKIKESDTHQFTIQQLQTLEILKILASSEEFIGDGESGCTIELFNPGESPKTILKIKESDTHQFTIQQLQTLEIVRILVSDGEFIGNTGTGTYH
jgi:hypothetical protein